LRLEGEDAFGIPETVTADFDKQSSLIMSKLSTDEQRVGFQTVINRHKLSMTGALYSHVGREMDKFEAGQVDAFVALRVNDAGVNADEPALVAEAIGQGLQKINDYGDRHGVSKEVLDQQRGKFLTAAHVNVLETLIDGKQITKAKEYFEGVKGQMSREAQKRIKDAIGEGDILVQ